MSEILSVDQREFRNALGCFATGVTVVTAIDKNGEGVGITANSFSAVSLNPPLVLWCVGRSAVTFPVFETCKAFTVSVLGAAAAETSGRYSMKDGHRIERGDTVPTKLGPPAFIGALAVFECDLQARHDGGDHLILIGRVQNFSYTPNAVSAEKPLVFYRGRYGSFGPLKD